MNLKYSDLLDRIIYSEFPNIRFDNKGLIKWIEKKQSEINRCFKKGRSLKSQRFKYNIVTHFRNSPKLDGNSFSNIYISELEENKFFYVVTDVKRNMMGQITRYKYQYLHDTSSFKLINKRIIMIR